MALLIFTRELIVEAFCCYLLVRVNQRLVRISKFGLQAVEIVVKCLNFFFGSNCTSSMIVPFDRITIASHGYIHAFAANCDAHVDGHCTPFVVFLLSDVEKQMEITHNYKLKKLNKSKFVACFYQDVHSLNRLIVN